MKSMIRLSKVLIRIFFLCTLLYDCASAWSSSSSSSSSSSLSSLSSTTSPITNTDLSPSRSRLQDALRSLSGKPTITPEIIIPEPNDPTVLLLRSTQVTQLSHNIRTKAKANAALVVGSMDALQTFCSEQEAGGRGNIPGPIPILYTYRSFVCGNIQPTMEQVATAGVVGVIHPMCQSLPITNLQMIVEHGDDLLRQVQEAKKYGIQVLPELIIPHDLKKNTGDLIQEDDWITLVDTLASILGGDPVAILLTMQESPTIDTTISSSSMGGGGGREEEEGWALHLPKIPKSLTKRLPIVGSVRVMAGQNRMGSAVTAYKTAGFSGSILRSECVPGYRMNPDLQFVSQFWTAAVSDIKSTKSKSFNFRSKINQDFKDRDLPMEWYNYQKNIMESGALGGDAVPGNVNTANGDFAGF